MCSFKSLTFAAALLLCVAYAKSQNVGTESQYTAAVLSIRSSETDKASNLIDRLSETSATGKRDFNTQLYQNKQFFAHSHSHNTHLWLNKPK